jgi:threonylcarbamoyladenosine tRNA methylthiotransferase MtaB
MKASILTLGCKVNQAESAIIEGNLVNSGFSIVPLSEQPDYCIVNTCTVTAKSDYQSRQVIRKALRAGSKVIVTGCYSQLRPEEIKRIRGDIDIVQNNNKLHIINMLSGKSKSKCLGFSYRARPYIKIQDGCNFACTYCTVPKARGKSRSLGISEILEQAYEYESLGYNEIVLTGIHLGSYGYDLNTETRLVNILGTLLNKTRISRIRLSSMEVNEINSGILELLSEERICRHLHIPLQSGDDTTLKRMNRAYSVRGYMGTIEDIIIRAPDIALGTDIIVGFPGESEEEFLRTVVLADSLPFSYMHIFPFSPRPDTLASKMPDQISVSVKKKRYDVLNSINNRKKAAYASSHIDKILDVIVEEESDDKAVIGTSSNYLKVKICSDDYAKKSRVHVRVSEREGNLLKGFPIDKM